MTESDARALTAGVVERLLAKGVQPFQIRVFPNGSGATVRVGFENSLMVEAKIPPGYFTYDRIADDLCHQISTAVIDSDGARP